MKSKSIHLRLGCVGVVKTFRYMPRPMSELYAKLRANHHRRKREQFIRDANPTLSRVLESSDVVTGLDVQTWISSVPWPTFDNGRLTTTKGDLAGSTFSDWDDRIHVADALVAIPLPPAVDAHLYLCLLYTSPSPRDQRGSRMPSSA